MMNSLAKILRVGLGFFLIITLISARFVHVSDFYESHEKCSDHSFVKSFHSNLETSPAHDNDSRHHEPTASHCHGAQCVFMLAKSIKAEYLPIASDLVAHHGRILKISFGIQLEDIDPPKIFRL